MHRSFVLLLITACVYADVSHLSMRYLPPSNGVPMIRFGMPTSYAPPSMTTTEIERQDLRELPVQIEYMQQQSQQPGSSSYFSRMSSMQMPMFGAGVSMRYLPPTPQQQQQSPQFRQQPQEMRPAEQYLPPTMRSMMSFGPAPPAMPNQRYLPPTMQRSAMSFALSPQQQMPQFMPQQREITMFMPSTRYLPPTANTQMSNDYMDAMPAHMLAADGYHYKNPSPATEQRFRLRHK